MKSKNLHVGDSGQSATWGWAWLPPIAFALAIFGASSIHGKDLPPPAFPHFDKVIHAGIYGLLAAGFARAWSLRTGFRDRRQSLLVGCLLAVGYGLTDEIHQLFVVGRSADPFDLAADAAGALIGVGLYLLFRRALFVQAKGRTQLPSCHRHC